MNKKNFIHFLLFITYLSLLIYLVLFSAEFGREVVSRNYNLIPFDTIGRYITYRSKFGELNYVTNIYGNILAFVPLGYFVFVFQKKPVFFMGAILSFLLSVAIEISQYLLSVGSLDVDDVILNTLGGALMYLVLYIISKVGAIFHEK
jgi:glycopeptide antibiotics resistance protein